MNDKKTHADQVFIDGLVANNSQIISSIYKKFVPKVVNAIKQNSGSYDQAQDVVQEVLIAIFNQAKTKGLQLTCPFDAYFFLLCKRKWLNELNKVENKKVTNTENFVYKSDLAEELVLETEMYSQKEELYKQMFEKLGEKCKEMLQTSFTLKTMEEVAEKLKVSYAYARKKKSLCTAELTKLIQDSVVFKNLKK